MLQQITKKIVGIFLLVLIIFLPLNTAYAQTFFDDEDGFNRFDDEDQSSFFDGVTDYRDLGEVISINVKAYEPTIIPVNVLEERSVPVYAYLEGVTAGSFMGMETSGIEPLYGQPKIKRIRVWVDEKNKFVGGVRHVRPATGIYTLDDL